MKQHSLNFPMIVVLSTLGANIPAHAQPAPPVSPPPVVNYEYDANGNRKKIIQAKDVSGFGFATQSAYDTLDRRITSIDARNKSTGFGYDGRENLTSVLDPRQLSTGYTRNGLGDVTALNSPDTGADPLLTYDAAGNLKTRTDSRGVLATNSYDALNRLTSIVYSKSGSASRTVSWTYDQTGTGFSNGIGRLTSTAHPDGSGQFTYDAQGRVLTDTQVVSAKSGANSIARTFVVTYGYDAAGNITSITYPSGRMLTISYAGGLPNSMVLARNSAGAGSATLISSIAFDAFGGPTSWNWQMTSGTQAYQRIYDTSGRLVRYRLGLLLRDISYDAAGRIIQYTHYDAASGVSASSLDQTFGYDELGRLTTAGYGANSWVIDYDDNGNRSGVTLNGTQRVYNTLSTSNKLASITNPTRSFGYDAGNISSDIYTATYNLANRLATLVKAGVTTTYTFDGIGRRVRKFSSSGNATTVIYVYDRAGQLLGEYDNTGKEIREYVWLGNIPVAVFTSDPTGVLKPPLAYYIHTDHINAPRVVLDKGNNIRWRWLAEPFGTTAAEDNPAGLGVFGFSLRMPGQLYDAESGLHYNGFRDYDPSIGRYVQSDPIGLNGGINTYAYVDGNPISGFDVDGLFEVKGYPNNTFDKRKYPQQVQDLYKYAANLKGLIDKACPGNNKAKVLYEKWVVEIVARSGNPVTTYGANISEFPSDFFDTRTYKSGAPSPQFTFSHEFMHLVDSNYKLRPSVARYIEAYNNGVSNDLPIEKHADGLVRDLMSGKCPCD